MEWRTIDAFVLDQDLLDNQADDPLPLLNVEGVSGATQPAEECREGFGEAQIDGSVIDLIKDRQQFRLQGVVRVAAVPACVSATRRAREALPDRRSAIGRCSCGSGLPLGAGRSPACRAGSAVRGRRQPAIELVLDQAGILQQSDDLRPHRPDRGGPDEPGDHRKPARQVAPPGVGTQASVIMDFTSA